MKNDLISRSALLEQLDAEVLFLQSVGGLVGDKKKTIILIKNAPAVDAVEVVRCRCCSPDDCGGMEWDFEDLEITMTLQRGKLIICNSFGDEAEVPIRHCPICGAKMDGGKDNDIAESN